jgi:periplasmic protein TonB
MAHQIAVIWSSLRVVDLPDGALKADSLKLVSSRGQPKLDESALKTIRACAPFDPAPHEITLKITVKYGR